MRGGDGGHHPSIACGVERREGRVEPGNLVAEGRREVLFVAEKDVDERHERPVHLPGAGLAADSLPEAGAVVEVVAHDRCVAASGGHRLGRDIRRGGGQRREDAAGVEPAGALPTEEGIPVDLARAQLAGRRVPPVRDPDRPAEAEAALGEVEPVADRAPDAVVGDPADVREVNPALEAEILDEPANRVVDERGDDRRPQAEAAPEGAGNVVFAASLPGAERARRVDALLARVEPQHHLAERDEIPAGGVTRLDHGQVHPGCLRSPARRPRSSRARRTSAAASVAISAMLSHAPAATASGVASHVPPTATTDRRARYAATSLGPIPPVGT